MDTGEEGQESPWVLNNSTDGDSTSSPGKSCQSLITLTTEKGFYSVQMEPPVCPLPLVCHWALLRRVQLLPLHCLPSGTYSRDKIPLSLLSSSPSSSAFAHRGGASI